MLCVMLTLSTLLQGKYEQQPQIQECTADEQPT